MVNICLLKCNIYNYKKKIELLYEKLFDNKIHREDIYDCLNNQYPTDSEIEKYDLFIITGARCIEVLCRDKINLLENLLILIRKIIDHKKKIYATCFGHQILSHFFGATVKRRCSKNEWEIGFIKLALNEPTNNLIPYNNNPNNNITIMSTHRDYVNNIKDCKNLYPLAKKSHSLLISLDNNREIQTISCQGHFLFGEKYFQKDKKDFFNRPYPKKYTHNFLENQITDPQVKEDYLNSRCQFKKFIKKYLLEKQTISQDTINNYQTAKNNSEEIIPKC